MRAMTRTDEAACVDELLADMQLSAARRDAIHSRADNLSPVGDVETRFGERRQPLAKNHRLSCQALIRGDLVIDVPPESQMHRQVVRKQADGTTHKTRVLPVLFSPLQGGERT